MPITRRARLPFRLVLALGLVVAASACDSTPQRVGDNPRQVTVVGSGHVQGVPDTLTADVGIEFTAPDVTAAMNQTNDRQQAVINALAGAGVDRKDISTTEVSLQPQYDSSGGTITGYRADNSIRVKIHPADSASHVLADHRRYRRRRHPDQFGQLLHRRRFAAGEGRACPRFSGRQGPRRAVRAAVRARPGQDHLDLRGVGRCADGAYAAPLGGAMPSNVPLEPGQQTVSFSVTAVWELR